MLLADPRQKIALSGIVSALFFSFSFILIGALYFPFTLPPMEAMVDKFVFVWQNILFAALPLAGGQLAVLLRKFQRPSTLDGDPVQDGSRLDIHIRFVRDTAYSLLLFIVMLGNLALYLEGDFLRLIPVLTSWFIVARLYYWAAYLINPLHRIFGATATMAPIMFFLLWSLAHMFGLG